MTGEVTNGGTGRRSARICSVPGCSGKHKAGDLCMKHYQRVRRTGTTARRLPRVCKVSGCTTPTHAKGYCNSCYRSIRRAGLLDLLA